MLRKTMLYLALVSAALALVLIAVIGGRLGTAARAPADSPANVAAPAFAPIVGELAGATTDGTPVYRLPAIAVTTTRSEVLARIEREERLAVEGAVRVSPTVAQAPARDVRAAGPGPVVR